MLKLCHPTCRTVCDLRTSNAQLANVSDQVLLTLVGLRILQQFFGAKKNCWALVASKAVNAIVKETQVSKEAVQAMVDQVVVNFSVDPSVY